MLAIKKKKWLAFPWRDSGTAKILLFCLLFIGPPRCLEDCARRERKDEREGEEVRGRNIEKEQYILIGKLLSSRLKPTF